MNQLISKKTIRRVKFNKKAKKYYYAYICYRQSIIMSQATQLRFLKCYAFRQYQICTFDVSPFTDFRLELLVFSLEAKKENQIIT